MNEMLKMLKELRGELKKVLDDDDMKEAENEFMENMKKAVNQHCTISMKKDKNGEAKLQYDGCRLGLIISLIGIEQSILKDLECDEDEFKFIKSFVGTKR